MLVISESASNSSEKQKAQPVQLDERLAFDDENEITPEEAQLVCFSLHILFLSCQCYLFCKCSCFQDTCIINASTSAPVNRKYGSRSEFTLPVSGSSKEPGFSHSIDCLDFCKRR